MARTLVLMRHASAEGWSTTGDRGRKLSAAGRKEAAEAGAMLQGLGISHVLCSSATRTRETLACLGLGDVQVEYMDALYNCGSETLVQRIGEIDDEVAALLVIGHSPAIPTLASELTWRQDQAQANDIQCFYPTAAFSQFTLEGSWSSLLDDESLALAQIRRVGY